MAKTILKENKLERLTLPGFKTCCKATVMENAWYWQKIGTQIKGQNRAWKVDLHKYIDLVFHKDSKAVQRSEDSQCS